MDSFADSFCPRFHHAVEMVGRRWTGVVLRALLLGATRFSDLRAAVPGVSDRMLSERLRELQDEGIVDRRVHPETPVRVEYVLTPKGIELDTVVTALTAWSDRWVTSDDTVSEPPGRPGR